MDRPAGKPGSVERLMPTVRWQIGGRLSWYHRGSGRNGRFWPTDPFLLRRWIHSVTLQRI